MVRPSLSDPLPHLRAGTVSCLKGRFLLNPPAPPTCCSCPSDYCSLVTDRLEGVPIDANKLTHIFHTGKTLIQIILYQFCFFGTGTNISELDKVQPSPWKPFASTAASWLYSTRSFLSLCFSHSNLCLLRFMNDVQERYHTKTVLKLNNLLTLLIKLIQFKNFGYAPPPLTTT